MVIKWQQILTYASSGTIGLLSLIVLIANLSGMSWSDDGNKTCIDCYSEIRVNSTYWEIKVENAGDKPLVFRKTLSPVLYINLDKINELVTTNPPIKTEILVATTSKFATQKNEDYGYLRPLKSGDILIHRYSKSIPSESRFIIHGINVKTIVKWNFDLESFYFKDINIDPYWFGISIESLKSCYNEIYEEKVLNYDLEIIFLNETFCQDFPINKSCSNKVIQNFTRRINVQESTIIKSREICSIIGIEINGKKINWNKADFNCKRTLFKGCCDSRIDGNGDGNCTSGESYITFDVRNLTFNKYLFHEKLDKLRIE